MLPLLNASCFLCSLTYPHHPFPPPLPYSSDSSGAFGLSQAGSTGEPQGHSEALRIVICGFAPKPQMCACSRPVTSTSRLFLLFESPANPQNPHRSISTHSLTTLSFSSHSHHTPAPPTPSSTLLPSIPAPSHHTALNRPQFADDGALDGEDSQNARRPPPPSPTGGGRQGGEGRSHPLCHR